MSVVKIPAPSLAKNLVGEPAEREILIYLPPSYSTPDKRFPTVYYLRGHGDDSMIGFYSPAILDTLIKNGKVKDMIVVIANGISKMGGSFYVNSPVTGNREDFIAQDVFDYVDSHFPTLAQPESRGIPVKVEAYNGSHESALGDRIRDHMFPFFAATLKSE